MNILYYIWNKTIYADIRDTLSELGHNVEIISYDLKDYLIDKEFFKIMADKIDNGNYDCIFIVNYFPIVSKISLNKKIKYISLIF